MSRSIGPEGVGDFARRQLDAARRDPRLQRDDAAAMVADFWDALEETERVRTLSLMGLHELTFSLEREEARLGVRRDAGDLNPNQAGTLQAAYERAEWARLELASESPHGNAQALISMTSALDAMVEQLVCQWRALQVTRLGDEVLAKARAAAGDEMRLPPPTAIAEVEKVVRDQIDAAVPRALTPKGSGLSRYEKPLKRVGWGAPADRPLPSDLDAALTELGALRDVLVHRAGRVDETALKQAPTLRYTVGQLVRVSRNDYREYSAAVRCYAHEISFRGIRGWPEVTDDDGPDLVRWRNYALVNA